MMKKLFENEHPLETPALVGTDEEKIAGIRFWAELVALARSIDTTFISYENKLRIIQYLKKELDLVDVEINNVSSQVVAPPAEVPSAEQLPPGESADTNIVDLSSSAGVTNAVNSNMTAVPPAPTEITPAAKPKQTPTFSNLDKLRRVAGNSEKFVPETKEPNTSGAKAPTFNDLEKLRRAAGAGKYGIHHADLKK
jgi:hypothetical protein